MRLTIEDSEAKLVTEINWTESFNVNTAVMQGEALSFIPFNIAIDYTIKKLVKRKNI
jgi:glycopeptide antibiotics resistance protein